MHFRRLEKEEYSGVVAPYLIGIVSSSGQLDWDFMKNLLCESSRSEEERTGAVFSASPNEKLPEPRLWSPLYDEHVTYIAYGPSGETCEAAFPHEKEGVTSYHDYFVKHRGYDVPKESLLFDVQRLWALPSNFPVLEEDEESGPYNSPVAKTTESRYNTCTELASVKLAQGACFEPLVANAHVALLCSLLPQFLFFFERLLVTKSFINHCVLHIPTLGQCVTSLPVEKVSNALTAKSCSLEDSYDKLEWFGDAILKLVQTDSLMKSVELRQWIAFLHEGDLSTLRSGKIAAVIAAVFCQFPFTFTDIASVICFHSNGIQR
jgi:dsRNA-specific ribonuclease